MNVGDKEKKSCSGCAACQYVCAHGAIEMIADREGFLYPVVDGSKCRECGRCLEVCPFTGEYGDRAEGRAPAVFAATSRDKEETGNSSSAGVGYLLAKAVIDGGGAAYGAAFNEEFAVGHCRADSREGIGEFSGSKYVQSEMADTYSALEKDLEQGMKVLFTGTACQTAGIRSSLPAPLQENLLTCDILCYGVPSPLIFKEYLGLVSDRYRSKVKKVTFRSKTKGWVSAVSGQKIELASGRTASLKLFFRLFFDHIILRPSCTGCVYTTKNKPSDITIADFWSIKRFAPELYDPDGVSMVLLHSKKGARAFKEIGDRLHCRKMEESCLIARQFHYPAEENPGRRRFWRLCRETGIRKTLLRYEREYLIKSLVGKIKAVVGR